MNVSTFPNRPRSVLPLAGVIAAVSAAIAMAFSGGHAAHGHEHPTRQALMLRQAPDCQAVPRKFHGDRYEIGSSGRSEGMGNHSTRENAGSRTSSDLALWRESRLRQAGFDPQTALELAAEKSIDFHELLDLVDRGCPPHLAGRIVAPLESESESR